MEQRYDFRHGFQIDFNLLTGLSAAGKPTRRYLSDMRGMYCDDNALERMVSDSNPLVYEFYELGAPEDMGDLAFGTSIVYPGMVGSEFFMTKGHFHSVLDTAEVYFCLSGQGCMMMESTAGDWMAPTMTPGQAVYVPRGYAHRSVNVGRTPLVTFFAFRADAGHDYGTIETKGYRNLVVEANGAHGFIPNPKWA